MKKKPIRYRMDNSATIYPMVATKNAQSLFGLSAELSEPIEKETFLSAIELSFKRYPFYKVRIRNGFFRPYFEENNKPYILLGNRNFLLEPVSFKDNNDYPFATEIVKNRVYMSFFHALCDATGAMEFLKTVLHTYLKLLNKPIEDNGVRTCESAWKNKEAEDPFERYYKRFPLISGAKNMAGGYAYGVKEELLSNNRFESNKVLCKTAELLQAARKYNCTMTVFVAALLARAVFLAHDSEPRKYNYVFFIPVNYRKFFPSDSLRNFTGFARCVVPKEKDFSLETLISVIGAEMKKQMEKEELHRKLSFSSLMSKNPLMRVLPFIIKRRISLWGRGLGKMPRQTMIISNIGRVDFPSTEDVTGLTFFVNCNARTPENVGILSYKDQTTIAFLRKIVSEETEKTFHRLLSEFIPCELVKEYK